MEKQDRVGIYINGQLIGHAEVSSLPYTVLYHSNDPEELNSLMNEAVNDERYEDAAHYHDLLKKLKNKP